MNTTLRLLIALGLAGACTSAPQSDVAARSAPTVRRLPFSVDRSEAEIRRFEESDRTTPPPAGGIVFVGSSSIRMWRSLESDFPGLPVLNRGFGG
jgi:hypothetical protein